MLSTSQQRERAEAVARVLEYIHRHRLTLADLLEYGGEDLPNPKLPEKICDPARVKKARGVEHCWALIAKLGLRYAALEPPSNANSAAAPSLDTENRVPRRRNRRATLKPQHFQQLNQKHLLAEV